MAEQGAVVAIYNSRAETEAAVKEPEIAGIDMKRLSIHTRASRQLTLPEIFTRGDLCEQSTALTNHSDGGHPWARR
jgi:hypothetical protein